MYALPADFNELNLVGFSLDMVCIGPYYTRLEFYRPATHDDTASYFYLGIKGSVVLDNNTEKVRYQAEDPQCMANLVQLLPSKITNVTRVGTASLNLNFDCKIHLLIEGSDQEQFENYTIQEKGKLTVIV